MVNHILQFKANKILFGEYKVLYTFTFRFILVYGVTKSLQSIHVITFICARCGLIIFINGSKGGPPPQYPPLPVTYMCMCKYNNVPAAGK